MAPRRSKASEFASATEILQACRRMELEAANVYRKFARASDDPALVHLWTEMHKAEKKHAAAVERLMSRSGLLLPAVARTELDAIEQRLEETARGADDELPAADMIALAAAMEFSEMDELFAAVCRAGGIDPDAGRAEHVSGLVEAAAGLGNAGAAVRHLLAALIRLDRRAQSVAASPAAVAAN